MHKKVIALRHIIPLARYAEPRQGGLQGNVYQANGYVEPLYVILSLGAIYRNK